MLEKQDNYSKVWRKKKSHRWHLIQLTWYYTFRPRILAGWRKPSNQDDEFDDWSRRYD